MTRRPDLIVPIRDRRQHKRILTLKNFRRFVFFMAIFVAGITVQSDLRHSASDEYGRLFSKQISRQTEIKKVDVIHEAPVVDQTSADPLLVAPSAREQYLGVNGNAEPTLAASAGEPAPRGVSIVNGPNGVTIVRGEATRRPTLSGGIFRER